MTRRRETQKTKIEWTDYSWNAVKGICPTGCWYCYARRMYQRFKWNPEMKFELHDSMAIHKLHRKNIPAGSKVFVCSTFELFHPTVPKSWRKDIFSTIEINPKIIFQILTKFPQNIDREMPDNVWLGVTITGKEDFESRCFWLEKRKAKIKFWSLEPYFSDICEPMIEGAWNYISEHLNWIIVGRLTGYGNKYDPKKEWVEEIVKQARKFNLPIFLKDNLKGIWEDPLIQEFPCIAE